MSVLGLVMGPVKDCCGVEQGGIASNHLFQLVTDPELDALNSLGLGMEVGPVSLSVMGQADDEACVSPSLSSAQSLVDAAVGLATSLNLVNNPTKTKLIVSLPSNNPTLLNQSIVDGFPVTESSQRGKPACSGYNSAASTCLKLV